MVMLLVLFCLPDNQDLIVEEQKTSHALLRFDRFCDHQTMGVVETGHDDKLMQPRRRGID
jgi:hypothetical protein